MSDATSLDWGASPIYETNQRIQSPPKPSWPLMGDILTSRGGVPEHLIQWRRVSGEDDPEPQI